MSVKNELEGLHMEYKCAVARSSGISVARERLMNYMFGHVSEIRDAMEAEQEHDKQVDALNQEIEALNDALHEADELNASLRDQLKKYEKKTPAKE